jgi:hypothetical protein
MVCPTITAPNTSSLTSFTLAITNRFRMKTQV